jgi:hypothetical protein
MRLYQARRLKRRGEERRAWFGHNPIKCGGLGWAMNQPSVLGLSLVEAHQSFFLSFLFSIILSVPNVVIHTYFSHLIIKSPSCNLKWGVVTFLMNHYKILEESRSYRIYMHIYVIKCLVDPFNYHHISKFN